MPTSRLLGLPARAWIIPAIALVAAAVLVPPPGPPADPASDLFREPVLVTRGDGGYRPVPFGEHEDIGPAWAAGLEVEHRGVVDRRLGRHPGHALPGLGLFRRSDEWHYRLTAVRFDRGARTADPEALWMPAREAEELRATVVAELNRRAGRPGDRFAMVLDAGARRTSWASPQNALVVAAWLSVAAVCWAARPRLARRRAPSTAREQPHPQP